MVELGNYIGQVKWFNGSKGYGFITCLENRSDSSDELVGTEVFVHHTSINPSSETYRTLFKGEYIQFSMGNKEDKPNEPMAVGVQGVCGGSLQCDVRAEERKARAEHAAKNGGENRSNNGRGRGRRPLLVMDGDSVPEGYLLAVPDTSKSD